MKRNNVTLKTYFETGDYPTEAQFIDLIDSFLNIEEEDAVTGITDNGDGTYTFSLLSGGSITLNGADLPNDIPIANIAGLQAALDARDPGNFLSKDQDETTNGSISIVPDPATAQKFFSVARDAVSGPSIQTSAYVSLNDGASAIFGNSSSSDGQDSHIIIRRNGELEFNDNGSTHTVWHSGNDGSGSGLDADTLDGVQASNFLRSDTSDTFSGGLLDITGATRWLVSTSDNANQRCDARNEGTQSRLHWYGVQQDTGATQNFKHAWYDGSQYINIDCNSNQVQIDGDLRVNQRLDLAITGTSSGELIFGKSDAGSMNLQWEDNYLRWRRSGGGTIAGWRWDRFDTPVMTLTTSGDLTLAGDLTVQGGQISNNAVSTRDKIRVWTSSNYTIGMTTENFGSLGDFAMTFQMNSDNNRGFWWGDTSHSNAQGAMSLTTQGFLTLANHARIGFGESDSSNVSNTYTVQANGTMQATNFILSSDRRLKENIRDYEPKTIYVNWKIFDWREGDKNQIGVVAQEIQKIYPEFVVEDDKGMLSVKYTDLLVAKMAEKDRQIGHLEKRLEKMEEMLEKLTRLQMGSGSTF